MKGLEKQIPDKKKRKEHILTKMIYMSEYNKKNVFICQQLFGNSKLNLHSGDTLKLKPKDKWGIDKFDVIMGNPPYNVGGVKSKTGDRLTKDYKSVWSDFTNYSLENLKKEGYLIFITPSAWLRNTSKLHYILPKNHITWLRLLNNVESQSEIGGKIPTSIYILHNVVNNSKKETLVNVNNTISKTYLDVDENTPLGYFSIFDKLRKFIKKHKLELDVNTKNVAGIGDSIVLPRGYKKENKWCIDTVVKGENGPIHKVKHSEKTHDDFNKRKLIIANKSNFYGIFVDHGKLGLCGGNKYYILGTDLNILKKLIEFPIFSKVVCNYTKYRQDFLDPIAFSYIPDLRKLKNYNLKNLSENNFYKLIGLTKEEVEQINKLK